MRRKRKQVLKTINCPRCQENNSAVSKFYCRCGSPLNIQTALGVEQVRASGDAVINELVNDSEIQSIIVKKIMMDEQFRAKIRALV